jgi:hypothetical protein
MEKKLKRRQGVEGKKKNVEEKTRRCRKQED